MAPTVDYSVLQEGQRLQVESGGVYYAAEVVSVSKSQKRAKAPVRVHYRGYTEADDEFVGADRIRSKALSASAAAAATKGKAAGRGGAEPKAPLEFEMGYWQIRGLGAPLRMMFEYKEVKYTDHQYQGEDWFKEGKAKILEQNPLANLPWVRCGDDLVSQSNSVYSYIGQRLRFGSGPRSKLMNDQLLCEVYDVRSGMVDLVYGMRKINRTEDEFKASAAKICESPPFAKFEAWLDKYGTEYLTGKKPNTADFHLWEMLDQHRMLAERFDNKSIFDKFPKCKAFYDRFRALPTLQKYFESAAYKLPVNASVAYWY